VTGLRHVRLFKNGGNQAVRIPRELELPGTEALIYREGHRLILEPAPHQALMKLLRSWSPIDNDWPDIEDHPSEPVDLDKP